MKGGIFGEHFLSSCGNANHDFPSPCGIADPEFPSPCGRG